LVVVAGGVVVIGVDGPGCESEAASRGCRRPQHPWPSTAKATITSTPPTILLLLAISISAFRLFPILHAERERVARILARSRDAARRILDPLARRPPVGSSAFALHDLP
jgi:hypothetical protein